MAEEIKVDLEKVRDERCVPVAREMLGNLPIDLLPEKTGENIDLSPLVKKTLASALAADLNLTTETSYVIQLVLGGLTALNRTIQTAKTVPIDDDRFFGIGRKILSILAESNVTLGSISPEDSLKEFAPVQEKIDALFEEEELTLIEVKYIMDNIFEAFNQVNTFYSGSLERSVRQAEAKLFGLADISDLTLKKLDGILKDVSPETEQA